MLSFLGKLAKGVLKINGNTIRLTAAICFSLLLFTTFTNIEQRIGIDARNNRDTNIIVNIPSAPADVQVAAIACASNAEYKRKSTPKPVGFTSYTTLVLGERGGFVFLRWTDNPEIEGLVVVETHEGRGLLPIDSLTKACFEKYPEYNSPSQP